MFLFPLYCLKVNRAHLREYMSIKQVDPLFYGCGICFVHCNLFYEVFCEHAINYDDVASLDKKFGEFCKFLFDCLTYCMHFFFAKLYCVHIDTND